MWKTRQLDTPPASALPESSRATQAVTAIELNAHAALLAKQQSVIGAGIVLVGEIVGTESLSSLFIEGTVEGTINLPGTRVTVGRSGHVNAGIVAGNVVISGAVTGNVTATGACPARS